MSWYNLYIFVPLIAWFLAHTIKFLRAALAGDIDLRYFYTSGGMPSAHSAAVSALATTALVEAGWYSQIFGVSAVFAAVVIYDSFGVRRASGDQAAAINLLLRNNGSGHANIREVAGHKPGEVMAGILLGVVAALLITVSEWSTNASWLAKPPLPAERWIYFGVFVALLAAAVVSRVVINRRYKKRAKSTKQIKQALAWSLSGTALVGLLISLMQFQTAGSGQWRLWSLLLLGNFVIIQIILATTIYSNFKSRYAADAARLSELSRQNRKPR